MKTTSHPHLVFVYGTLQKGQGNNPVMLGPAGKDAVLLGKASTLPKFYMSGGGFPRVAKQIVGGFPASENKTSYLGQVKGEVWCLNDSALAACDKLEGHPDFYKREKVTITLAKDRTRLSPWMYIIADPFHASDCLQKNDSGLLEWFPAPWRKWA